MVDFVSRAGSRQSLLDLGPSQLCIFLRHGVFGGRALDSYPRAILVHHGIVFGICGLMILCCHLVGFGIFGMLVLAIELPTLFDSIAAKSDRFLAIRRLLLAIVIPAVVYFLWFDRGPGGGLLWANIVASKLAGSISPFFAYNRAFFAVSGLLGYMVLYRQLTWPPVGIWAIALLGIAFCFLPTDTLGSWFL